MGFYLSDRLEGQLLTWYADGKMNLESNYEKGLLHGDFPIGTLIKK